MCFLRCFFLVYVMLFCEALKEPRHGFTTKSTMSTLWVIYIVDGTRLETFSLYKAL